MRLAVFLSSIASLAALTLGCDGSLLDAPAGPRGSTPPGADAGTPTEFVPGSDPIASPIQRVWRLTPLQYERSFVAAFGTTQRDRDDFVPDPRQHGFDDVASRNHVDVAWAEVVQQNAAETAATLAPSLRTSHACLFAAPAARTCVVAFVEEYCARAFRRPVDAEVQGAYVDLFFALVAASGDAEDAAAGVLEAIAQSPYFLYRVEVGAREGDVERLDAYTIASQLSYMFTDAPPDAALLADAASDRLLDRAVVREHALRLLDTPQALEKVTRFFEQYLGIFVMRDDLLAKDPGVYPEFDAEIQAAMMAETDRFVERVAFAEGGTLRDVFTSDQTFVDDRLRSFYRWSEPASGDVATTAEDGRRGIFMHGSVLAAHSQSVKTDPLHRGLFVSERLLCRHIAPPSDVDIFELADLLEPPDPLSTERERLEYFVETQPSCGSCHQTFVSLGLGLETFDAVGVFRETHNGRPIDTSGEVSIPGGGGPFADGPELFERIVESPGGQACFAESWTTFAFGADVPVSLRSRLLASFRESDLRLRDLLVAVTQEDAFYIRQVEDER